VPFTLLPTRPGAAPILAPPALIFLATLLAAWGCDALWRWRLDLLPFGARASVAATLALAAALVGGWAVRTMKGAGTAVEPSEPTSRLVTSGPFRFTRNPLYLCLAALSAFFAFLVDSPWFVAAVPALFATLHFGVVLREEAYLEALFPGEYAEYRGRVRRWL
jgi:protein-S-isoprenylcysteine O-methyltransferase Ste14